MQIAQARELFWRAFEEYTNGRYGPAIELFEASYETYPQPEVLFNIALANAKSGNCDVARARAAGYAAQLPSNHNGAQAESGLLQVEQACGLEDGPAPILPSVPVPLEAMPEPAPGVPASAASQQPAFVGPNALAPSAAASPPIADDEPSASYWTPRRKLAWGLLGGAVVSGGLNVYFARELARGDEASNELMLEISEDEETADAGDRLAQYQEDRARSIWLFSVTAAAAVGFSAAGVALLATEPNMTAQVQVGGHGVAEISLSGRF